MGLEPEILKQLIETFRGELDEQSQLITQGLLALEKDTIDEQLRSQTFETIFRSAHNIKGAARGIGIADVGEIAHRIETLFSSMHKNATASSHATIDICLEAVDSMKLAFESFCDKKPLPFSLPDLLARLETSESKPLLSLKEAAEKPAEKSAGKIKKTNHTTKVNAHEYESVRVSIHKIDKISVLMEKLQANKIAMDQHFLALSQLSAQTKEFALNWKAMLSLMKSIPEINDNEGLQRKLNNCMDVFSDMQNITSTLHKNMQTETKNFSSVSNALQEEVHALRLFPATQLLNTLPRYIRDLSHELNKDVELVIHENEVKIDKMVLEGLKDPIMHLVRNAIDHGIESVATRQTLGKPEIGRIVIDVLEEGNHVIIRLSDDGAGIDVKKIAARVIQKNIATENELSGMSEEEILHFIFSPGFSTKEIITDLSGRGIGLDVVRSNLKALKGHVSVSTTLGKGTTFDLEVPLTLASERGLLVKSSDQLFIIPTHSIERVLAVDVKDIVNVEGGQALMIDNHVVRLSALSHVIGFQERSGLPDEKFPVLLIRHERKTVALVIEELLGEREIIVKPLAKPFTVVPCVAGGTLLEGNEVVIVLDPSSLVVHALRLNLGPLEVVRKQPITAHAKPRILVVDDSITTRTLEKNLLESKDYHVTIAVNGKEAWDLLQKQTFNLVITDVMMPIMDGFQLTEHVKKSDKLRELPVIIVTSLGSDSEKKRGIDVGANAYIVKSEFESGTLLDIVAQLV